MNVDLAYFEIPFRKPYRVGTESISVRRGIMIRTKTGKRFGYGVVFS